MTEEDSQKEGKNELYSPPDVRQPYITKDDLAEKTEKEQENGGGLEKRVDTLVKKVEKGAAEGATAVVYVGTLALAGAIVGSGAPIWIAGGTALGIASYIKRKRKGRKKKPKKGEKK